MSIRGKKSSPILMKDQNGLVHPIGSNIVIANSDCSAEDGHCSNQR